MVWFVLQLVWKVVVKWLCLKCLPRRPCSAAHAACCAWRSPVSFVFLFRNSWRFCGYWPPFSLRTSQFLMWLWTHCCFFSRLLSLPRRWVLCCAYCISLFSLTRWWVSRLELSAFAFFVDSVIHGSSCREREFINSLSAFPGSHVDGFPGLCFLNLLCSLIFVILGSSCCEREYIYIYR